MLHDIGEADVILLCVSAVPDHELCGSVGGSGVCAGQGAVQGPQPCHPVWVHRRHCGAAARWLPSVLPLPRPLRQDGSASVTRESGTMDSFRTHLFNCIPSLDAANQRVKSEPVVKPRVS